TTFYCNTKLPWLSASDGSFVLRTWLGSIFVFWRGFVFDALDDDTQARHNRRNRADGGKNRRNQYAHPYYAHTNRQRHFNQIFAIFGAQDDTAHIALIHQFFDFGNDLIAVHPKFLCAYAVCHSLCSSEPSPQTPLPKGEGRFSCITGFSVIRSKGIWKLFTNTYAGDSGMFQHKYV